MVVYIEYVLIDNFVIDYLLLKATFVITNISVKKGRLFLCAFLGGVFALTYPFMQRMGFLLTIIKILFGLLLTLLATNYKSVKSYYVNTLIFFALTFLTGGTILGLSNILGIELGTEFSVAIIILPTYLIIKGITELIKYIYRRKETVVFLYDVELTLNGKTVKAKGFLDTGNGLYYNNQPVIICNKGLFLSFINSNSVLPKMEKIECKTVAGSSILYAVKINTLKIYLLNKPRIFNNVVMAISKVDSVDYQVILHSALMEEIYDNSNAKIKNVS